LFGGGGGSKDDNFFIWDLSLIDWFR
jgi:hypothetical protein